MIFILTDTILHTHTLFLSPGTNVETLKSLCLQYAAATQWLISSSIDIPKAEESTDSSLQFEKSKQGKLRNSSESRKFTTGNATVTDSILKFEREFNEELQSWGPILSNSSQAEPYLTHLAQLIIGVNNEQ